MTEFLQRTAGNCEVAVGRELTKVHEELVRGPINDVARKLGKGRGEFTIVACIGRTPDIDRSVEPPAASVVIDFGEMTILPGVTKRKAINMLARKHGIAPNRVYEILEASKKSV